MVCSKCGAQLPEGAPFCTEGGAPVQQTPVQQAYNAAVSNPAINTTPILILGILALVLCETVIGGIICAILCKKKVKEYVAAGGQIAGKVKVGNILATVGLIFSIIYIVVWIVCIIVGIAGVAASGALSNITFN